MLKRSLFREFTNVSTRLRDALKTLHFNKLDRKFETTKLMPEPTDKFESLHYKANDVFKNSSAYKAYTDKKSREFEKESVLRSYNKIVNGTSVIEEHNRLEKLMKKEENLQRNFFNIQDNNERKRRLKSMLESARKGHEFEFDANQNLSEDYNRFNAYKDNYLEIKDNIGADEHFHEDRNFVDYMGSMLNQFKNQSPKDLGNGTFHNYNDPKAAYLIHNKDVWDEDQLEYKQNVREMEAGFDPENKGEHLDSEDYQMHRVSIPKEERFEDPSRNINEIASEDYIGDGFSIPHLSYSSRRAIYSKYMQGAKIKDLADEFGLYPTTVKYAIYQESYYIEHILPFLGEEEIEIVMLFERALDSTPGSVDYGYDIQRMLDKETGTVEYGAAFMRRDMPISKKYQKDVKELYKKKIPDVEEVIENFVGSGEKGYFIKKLNVKRGEGATWVGKAFKKAIQESEVKDTLPYRARQRLDKGPRYSVKGLKSY